MEASGKYPKPGPVGGRLIRKVIGFLRAQGVSLPIDSHILIACSGGLDSTALALLIARYGRRVATDPARVTLLHINHGWRGAESDEDAKFARALARRLGVRFRYAALKPGARATGSSWEDEARKARRQIFEQESARLKGMVLTAHQADDVAETVLWRILTGAASTHGGGISVRSGVELRPLLAVRKSELKAFLEEEGVSWREDRTNHEGRFLRSRMRLELIPVLERLFPRAVSHLVELALETQKRGPIGSGDVTLGELFGAAGCPVRRPHWEGISRLSESPGSWKKRLDLPEGWQLRGERRVTRNKSGRGHVERWILERSLRSR